jgi:hypothetical protein
MDPVSEPEDRYTFCGCGKKNCPSVLFSADSVLIEAPSDELEPTATGSGVRLNAEQVAELLVELKKRGF